MCKSHKKYHKFIPLFIVLGIGLAFLAGWVVQLLWNATITDIFHSQPIGYWQAVMLLVLCKILFGAKISSHHSRKHKTLAHLNLKTLVTSNHTGVIYDENQSKNRSDHGGVFSCPFDHVWGHLFHKSAAKGRWSGD